MRACDAITRLPRAHRGPPFQPRSMVSACIAPPRTVAAAPRPSAVPHARMAQLAALGARRRAVPWSGGRAGR
jgi:hypothetical protein